MQIDHFQSIRLGEEPRLLRFGLGRLNAAVAMAAPMPAPNATREAQEITAEVSADIVLRAVPAERNPNP